MNTADEERLRELAVLAQLTSEPSWTPHGWALVQAIHEADDASHRRACRYRSAA